MRVYARAARRTCMVERESFAPNAAPRHSDAASVSLNGDWDWRATLEGRSGVSGGVALRAGGSSCAGKPTDEGDTSGRLRGRWDEAARDDHRTTAVTASRVARRYAHTHTHTSQAARRVKRRSQRKWSDGTLRGDRRLPMESPLALMRRPQRGRLPRGGGLFNFALPIFPYFLFASLTVQFRTRVWEKSAHLVSACYERG